ncbi:MAG: 3-deoxy-D-manno-octulosonic acid transferase [Succinivibrionaceae bacterium]|nr:3-deoxy-D-manno-octulosonic acid transferase [Succinivibrionaceae bacterium]
MILRAVYTLAGYLLLPFLLLYLALPKKGAGGGKGGERRRLRDFMGLADFVSRPDVPAIWFHTVSVGETLAAGRLIREFHQEHPDFRIVVTTSTATGAACARGIGDFVEHCYAPLDYPHAIALFLGRVKPRMLVIMETELWPNWLAACRRRGVKTVLMNARMSARSAGRYARLGGFFASLIGSRLDRVLAQTPEDADRFLRLGAKEAQVSGSLKFDIVPDGRQVEAGRAFRTRLGKRPVWIAASTHQGEDEIFLKAHLEVRKRCPKALLLLAPRHPERFDGVLQLARKTDPACRRLSELDAASAGPGEETSVVLCDAMGQMFRLFEASDLAVMGGSFADVGGHNPLEPAALGRPVIMGPWYYNFKAVTLKMKEAGALTLLDPGQDLAEAVASYLADGSRAAECGRRGREIVAAGRGSTRRTLDEIGKMLGD